MKTVLLALLAAAAIAVPAAASSSSKPKPKPKANTELLHPWKWRAKAPAVFRVHFATTKGAFVVTVHRDWAPLGADRFYNLVRAGFYDGDRLFRVVPGFVVQFGISPSAKVSKAWRNARIRDDPVRHSNTRGTVAFAATSAPNSRTTQIFVNLGNNADLDKSGFAPFGQVTSGIGVLGKLYAGYGEQPTTMQTQMMANGDRFVSATFPKLDRVLTAELVGGKSKR